MTQALKIGEKMVPALPDDRDHKILASGVRKEGVFPQTRFIAWWDHPDCTREYDGKDWQIYARGEAPARIPA